MSRFKYKNGLFTLVFLILIISGLGVNAQPFTSIELKKPTKYENRSLPAEKTGDKKFSKTKRFYQNTVSHYNYYFNAQKKINEILEKGKAEFQDDYNQLLPFYNYTLDALSQNKVQLDSVVYKCTSGILLHDLRTDWVDDLYLVMGQAYLYKKDFDSAAQIFQFINYAFAPKDGGYDLPIGSNASNNNGAFTVVSKESNNIWKKFTTPPPGRNEGFLWRIRTYLENNQLSEAEGLIEILRNDPFFPKRLTTSLHEMTAYAFYKEKSGDSAAWHLNRALDRAVNKQEKARWQFLIGQLYTQSGKDSLAILAYQQALKNTLDPTLEVYAHLAISALQSGSKPDAVQQNLNELLRMGKRPIFENYRDIIYYAAAKLSLNQNKIAEAQKYLLRSVQFSNNNLSQKQDSYLLLADLNYDKRQYKEAYRFYDSLQIDNLKSPDKERVATRKPALKTISENLVIINREDSLQKLALLPADERNAIVKAKLKQLRKLAGLKEQEINEPSFGGNTPQNGTPEPDLFGTGNTDFYFQNSTLKTNGFAEFKTKWGNRPNIDHWRRQSAIEKSFSKSGPTTSVTAVIKNGADKNQDSTNLQELTYESLLNNIPLTSDKIAASYLKVLNALLLNGTVFQNQISDYPSAIDVYSTVVNKFPDISETEKSLFNLANCYDRNNQPFQADSIRQLLRANFAGGVFTNQIKNQQNVKQKDPATDAYTQIYDLFVAGSFTEALAAKQKADKTYGKNYWTPQQLYIESIYYVKQQQDSVAINSLQEMIKLFPTSALAEKAVTMIDVLKRRKEIEEYLTKLTVEKQVETVVRPIDLEATTTITTAVPFKPETLIKQTPKEVKPLGKIELPKPIILTNKGYVFNGSDSQYVVITLEKVDGIFASEGKNAFNRFNKEIFYNQQIPMSSLVISSQFQLILMGPFANAGDAVGYINKTRPMAASRIIPWLAADKYSFNIISNNNLNLLKESKDVAAFKSFMHGLFPDLF